MIQLGCSEKVLKKSSELTFELPQNLQKYVCKKGSIAIDGSHSQLIMLKKKAFLLV